MTHPFPAVIMKGNFKIQEETHRITFLTPSNHIGRLQGRWWGVSRLVLSDFVTPWTAAHQAPLSMEFSRQEYGGGLPFPSPGDLPDPGIESPSPARYRQRFFTDFFFFFQTFFQASVLCCHLQDICRSCMFCRCCLLHQNLVHKKFLSYKMSKF